jgi:hypothetical protein
MGIRVTVTKECTCDSCGRKPDEGDGRDARLYGWVALHPEHLTTSGLGHNVVSLMGTVVFCPQCLGKFPILTAKGGE